MAVTFRFGILLSFGLALFASAQSRDGRRIRVADANQLRGALQSARAGDEILLASGTYRIRRIAVNAAGTRDMPIVVRAERPLEARIEVDAVEGFNVSGPHWHFEQLDIRGVCSRDSDCEHAVHVVGNGDGFVLRGNRVFDFNAHLKVNFFLAPAGARNIPDDGLIEGNEFGNNRARQTDNPVTPLNIDNGSGWIVRGNYVHDFHKSGGDRTSYGMFAKGGARDALFERNLIVCERDVARPARGVTVGMSFGGGGMGPDMCAPAFDANVPCDPEVRGGLMRNNIVANCSDVGIYLNRAADTRILHNTLVATSGIDVRFRTSTAEIQGNVLTGPIRERDGGSFTGDANLQRVAESSFTDWYADPMKGNLRRTGNLESLIDKGSPSTGLQDDYCGRARSDGKPDFGAIEHSLGDCASTLR